MKWMVLLLLLPAGVLAEDGEAIFPKPSFGANYFVSPLKASGGSEINERSIDLDLFLPLSPNFAWTLKYSRRSQEWSTPLTTPTKYDGDGYNVGFRLSWN